MDDARIRELTEEVLADLSRPRETDAPGVAELEARVAALESAVGGLVGGVAPAVAVAVAAPSHPSLRLLEVGGGTRQCVMEPDKPCVQSGACRTFGH